MVKCEDDEQNEHTTIKISPAVTDVHSCKAGKSLVSQRHRIVPSVEFIKNMQVFSS